MNEHDLAAIERLASAIRNVGSASLLLDEVTALIAALRAAWADRDEAVNAAHWLSLERERLQLAMDAAISEMPDSFYRRDLQAALTPTDAVVHRCPPEGSGLMPCCGRTPFDVARTDRMTSDPALVTCSTPVEPDASAGASS